MKKIIGREEEIRELNRYYEFLTSTVVSPLPLFQCLPVSDLPAFLEVVAL